MIKATIHKSLRLVGLDIGHFLRRKRNIHVFFAKNTLKSSELFDRGR